MPRLPKGIREVNKRLDRSRFEIGRRTNHWAVVDKTTGAVVQTIHENHGGRGLANQLSSLRQKGALV